MVILPLCVDCDLSQASLQQALIDLDYNISKNSPYILHVSKQDLKFLNNILPSNKLFNIEVKLEDKIKPNSWYLEDVLNQTIIYSRGA